MCSDIKFSVRMGTNKAGMPMIKAGTNLKFDITGDAVRAISKIGLCCNWIARVDSGQNNIGAR
jgi:hypothetical protein